MQKYEVVHQFYFGPSTDCHHIFWFDINCIGILISIKTIMIDMINRLINVSETLLLG